MGSKGKRYSPKFKFQVVLGALGDRALEKFFDRELTLDERVELVRDSEEFFFLVKPTGSGLLSSSTRCFP